MPEDLSWMTSEELTRSIKYEPLSPENQHEFEQFQQRLDETSDDYAKAKHRREMITAQLSHTKIIG